MYSPFQILATIFAGIGGEMCPTTMPPPVTCGLPSSVLNQIAWYSQVALRIPKLPTYGKWSLL